MDGDRPPVDLETIGFIGGLELFVLVTVLAALTTGYVYVDARARGTENPGLIAGAIGFLFLFYALPGLAAFIVYLGMRQKLGEDGDRSA